MSHGQVRHTRDCPGGEIWPVHGAAEAAHHPHDNEEDIGYAHDDIAHASCSYLGRSVSPNSVSKGPNCFKI